MKQRGALLPKGRLLGIQFLELFKDNLFFEIGQHENLMASKLAKGLKDMNISFFTEAVSNQIFPIVENKTISKLQKKYEFHIWEEYNETKSVIRLVASWATKEEVVDEFLNDFKEFIK